MFYNQNMRVLGLALVALLAVASGFAVYSRIHKSAAPSVAMLERYNRWKVEHAKLYATPAENNFRLQIFSNKALQIDQDNAIYAKWMVEHGHGALERPMFKLQPHSDLTDEEFKKMYTGLDVSMLGEVEYSDTTSLPEYAGLAQVGYTHQIRNQGACGSCWAFSTVATLNKQYFDKYRTQVQLSEQDLVDCSEQDGGCVGGWPARTYYHVQANGIAMDSEYPYTATVGNCRSTSQLRSGRTDLGGEIASSTLGYSQGLAQYAASVGVLAGLAIHSAGRFASADLSNNQAYNPAVFDECSKNIDHAVNLYKADATVTTIINSWSTRWGTGGYGKIIACPNGLLGSPAVLTHSYKYPPTA